MRCVFRISFLAFISSCFVVAMIFYLDLYLFDRHGFFISNTSGSDIEVLEVDLNGYAVRRKDFIVIHNDRSHLGSKYFSEFKVRSNADGIAAFVALKEGGGGVKVEHCFINTLPHTDCIVFARYAGVGVLRCVCESLSDGSM